MRESENKVKDKNVCKSIFIVKWLYATLYPHLAAAGSSALPVEVSVDAAGTHSQMSCLCLLSLVLPTEKGP